ncbi:MAG: N-acetylneuraminate synthase family protein [Magnetovibrio sp.]|nr:N-acetylneuraminate synthase family protein [Magnetovibrio sp.]
MSNTAPLFGQNKGVAFIAEVSSNHHRDLDRCLSFIDEAHKSGCRSVKFQLFRIDELFAPEILKQSPTHRARKDWELPVEFLPKLSKHTHAKGMLFSCTPFYLDAVKELEPFVDFYKIASYELMWDELLSACAKTGKPIMLSTGMATMDEINHAVEILKQAGCEDLTLLHCVSSYPSPPEHMNLSAIETIRNNTGVMVGLSDHSVQPGVIYRATHKFGAHVVEFHLDLDGDGEEYAAGHCWLPHQIKDVINTLNTGFEADGTGIKEPTPSELPDRDWRADPSDGLRPLKKMRKNWKPE